MPVEITRLERTDKGTIGALLVDGRVVCWTLELPWRDNQPNKSCIPTGKYPLVLEWSEKYKRKLYELKDVPGRSEVKIHTGNYLSDILGCVLVGTMPGYDDNQERVVWKSAAAFDDFMAAMYGRESDEILVRGV